MLTITPAQLTLVAPHGAAALIAKSAAEFTAQCPAAAIDTPVRLAHFVAQLAYESRGFTTLEENLDYSATRLMQVWPKRFVTYELASSYAHQPERLANFVYGGRADLGNVADDDGWKFRGRGYAQITGRKNYDLVGFRIRQNLLLHPDLLTDPAFAAAASIAFWCDHGLNHVADADDAERVTKAINGGLNGYEQRLIYLARAKKAFGV